MRWTFWLLLFLAIAVIAYFILREKREYEFIGLRPLEERLLPAVTATGATSSAVIPSNVTPSNVTPSNVTPSNVTPSSMVEEICVREHERLCESTDDEVAEEVLQPAEPALIVDYVWTPPPSRIREMLGTHDYLVYCYKNRRNVAAVTLGEWLCRTALETIFQLPFPSSWPYFLRSPRTGRNLELDGYCAQLRLAFEFNGKQHNQYPNHCHKTEEEFLQQVARDRFKRRRCQQVGITLLTIPEETVPYPQIPEYIANLLPPEFTPYRYDIITM